jgi:hypothetical protein
MWWDKQRVTHSRIWYGGGGSGEIAADQLIIVNIEAVDYCDSPKDYKNEAEKLRAICPPLVVSHKH